MEIIKKIIGREVLDSRGNPTVEVELETNGGITATAIAPAGASKGKYEALDLRDNDPNRYHGMGVRRAIQNVNDLISKKLTGISVKDQASIDNALIELDGTGTKTKLGANAILPVSIAAAKCAARAEGIWLYEYIAMLVGNPSPNIMPFPIINAISGGLHGYNGVDFQDYLIFPIGAYSYSHAIEMAHDILYHLAEIIKSRQPSGLGLADEGGYSPALASNEQGCLLLAEAIDRSGYQVGSQCAVGIDVAASHFYSHSVYTLSLENRSLTSDEMIEFLTSLVNKHPIVSLEDPLSEDDWEAWQKLSKRLLPTIQLIADDLTVTNLDRINKVIREGIADAILIKMNQIGTLTETLNAVKAAKQAGYKVVISARSGETEDTTLADLAVGVSADMVKIGSLKRSSRLAKYNQLFRIQERLGGKATWRKQTFGKIFN